jgi:hypothetical protein
MTAVSRLQRKCPRRVPSIKGKIAGTKPATPPQARLVDSNQAPTRGVARAGKQPDNTAVSAHAI